MLSIKKISSSSEAGQYYQKADYYTKGEGQTDIESTWHGNGAEELGLKGHVDKESFVNILDGKLPNGQSLERAQGDRVPGWDLTFSAPKSVSLMALVGDDKRLLEAHLNAVKTTLSFLEKEYLVSRVMKDGESKFENTESMVAALYTHTTSRSLDPQLHTHSVVANATSDENGNNKAIESSPIFKNKMLLGQIYRSELANAVKDLGYDIDWDKHKGSFEIEGVTKEHIDAYSKRRKTIKEYAEKNDLKGGKDMDRAALATRESKKDIATRDVIKQWDQEAEKIGFEHEQIKEDALAKSVLTENKHNHADDIVRFAYNNLSYNEAVFTRQDLIKESLIFAHGERTTSSINTSIDNLVEKKELLLAKNDSEYGKNTVSYTTKQSINIELHNLKLLSRGVGEVGELGNKSQYKEFERRFNDKEQNSLMKEQADTVESLVFSKDRFTALQGYAGTGKSFSLKAYREFAEERGFNVSGYAPTGQASQNLMESAGIDSNTIDSLLERFNKGVSIPNLTGDIWVVDEAGMANSRQMNELLNAAIKTNARIQFVGDTKQLAGVESGKPFEQAQDDALESFKMSNIVRQNKETVPQLYNAVMHSIDGNASKAFESLKMSSSNDTGVKQLSSKKGIEASSNNYVELISKAIDKGASIEEAITKDTKLLILTNQDRRLANSIVREGLQSKGIIGKDELTTNAYINTQLKPEEKADVHFYKKGFVVRFLSENKKVGVLENSYYSVEKINKQTGTILLKNKEGNSIEWSPQSDGAKLPYQATVYEKLETKLAKGDFIRWKDKNEQAGLKNSDVGKIDTIVGTTVGMSLKDGSKVTFDTNDERYKHFEYEYASTLYAAQGDTYKNIVGFLDHRNKYLLSAKALYVGISRAVSNAMLYVTDESKVIKAIEGREGSKTSALEGVGFKYNGEKEAKSQVFATVPILLNLDEAVINAASELVNRESVFSRNELIKLVYTNTRTSYTVENINHSIDRLNKEKKLISANIDGKPKSIGAFTTNEAIVKEWRIATYIERGLGKHEEISPVGVRNESIAGAEHSIKDAMNLTLGSKDRFIGIISNHRQDTFNYLRSARQATEERGYNIRALSPSGRQATEVNQETDIPTQTIASFIHRFENTKTLPEYKNEIWLVDQAQMVSNADIEKIVSIADKTNARVIFNSQKGEIESIQSGGILNQLNKNGLNTASIENQNNSTTKLNKGLDSAIELKDKDERLKTVAEHVVSEFGNNSFVAFVPSKEDRESITENVRNTLKEKSIIGTNDVELATIENSNLNSHKQSIALNYRKGMLIKLNVDDKSLGLKKGEYYEIVKAGLGAVTINSGKGNIDISDARLKEYSAVGLQTFNQSKIKITKGDIVRTRINDKSINIKNGEILKVTEVNKEGATAINERGEQVLLDQKKMAGRFIEYGYTHSAHSTLGKDASKGVLLLESYRKNLVNTRSINSVLSNVKGGVELITDNVNKLKKNLSKNQNTKQSALSGAGILQKLEGREDFTNNSNVKEQPNIKDAMNKAISHLYEKESVFSRSELLQTTIKMSNAPLNNVNTIIDSMIKSGDLIQAKIDLDGKTHSAMITTKNAVKRERYIQDLFQSGKGGYKPIARTKDVQKISEKVGLNEREEVAVERVMTSKNQFVGLEGRQTKELYRSLVSVMEVGSNRNMRMRFFSPRNQLAEQIQERTGIETKSIQGHIMGLSQNEYLKSRPKDVWVITDSQMLSTREVADTMTLARRTGAKVIFHHDEKAAASMGQGQNLNVLKDVGFETHSINTPDTRKMRLLGKSYTDEDALVSKKGLGKFETIIEIGDKDERDNKMVSDYLKIDDKNKNSYLLVVANENDRKNITDKLRTALKLEGKLDNVDINNSTLQRVALSKSQKLSVDNYQKGYVVKFERGIKNGDIKPGEYLEIIGKEESHLIIRTSSGKQFNWKPEKVAAASSRGVHIFRKQEMGFAAGDKIRFTETSKKEQLQKGKGVTIIKIDKDRMLVKNEKNETRTLDLRKPEHAHIAHSYVETYTSAQSVANKPVVMGQIESFQKRLLSQRSLYTVMNKAKSRFVGYVDNKTDVSKQVLRKSGTKLNAIEIQDKSKGTSVFKARPNINDKPKEMPKQKERTFTFGKGFGGPNL